MLEGSFLGIRVVAWVGFLAGCGTFFSYVIEQRWPLAAGALVLGFGGWAVLIAAVEFAEAALRALRSIERATEALARAAEQGRAEALQQSMRDH